MEVPDVGVVGEGGGPELGDQVAGFEVDSVGGEEEVEVWATGWGEEGEGVDPFAEFGGEGVED